MANQSGSFSSAQLAAILNELNTDPQALGYTPFVSSGDNGNLCTLLNWVRDGSTPCPSNNVIGRSGAITNATNATPIVITSTGHGLATGDAVVIAGVGGNTNANSVPENAYGLGLGATVAPNPFWIVTKIDANSFSLNGSAGNAAYTSGGTWTWAVGQLANASKIFNQSIPVSQVIANILPTDAAAATALTGTQPQILPAFLNPNGNIRLTDPAGNELNTIGWLNLLTPAGSVSRKAVKALETRNGSRVEQILNLIGQSPVGTLVAPLDIVAAQVGHY